MAKKQNFDFGQMFKGVDMTAFDPAALLEIQRKNVEALVAANQKIAENMQAIAAQEQKYLQEMVENWTGVAGSLQAPGDIDDLKEVSAKQTEFALKSLEDGIENMRALVDMMTKGKEDSLKIINKRVDDSIKEVRATLDKSGAQ